MLLFGQFRLLSGMLRLLNSNTPTITFFFASWEDPSVRSGVLRLYLSLLYYVVRSEIFPSESANVQRVGSACEMREMWHSSLLGCLEGSAESTHVFLRVSALPWLLPFITVGTARRGSRQDEATCPRRGFDPFVRQGVGPNPYKRGSRLFSTGKSVERLPCKWHCPCSFKKFARCLKGFWTL